MKKFTLAVAAFGLVMLTACGDDSSSSANDSSTKSDEGYTVYNSVIDAGEAPCSSSNKCEIIIANDAELGVVDTMQCNGTDFLSMNGRAVAGCEAAESSSSEEVATESSSSEEVATESSSSEEVVESSSSEEISAESSSSEENVAAESSSSVEAVGPTGDLVSCEANIAGTEGEHSCIEVGAATTMGSTINTMCTTMASSNMAGIMEYTAGTSCGAGEGVLKCIANGANIYSMDGKYTDCETFIANSMFGAMVGGSTSGEEE